MKEKASLIQTISRWMRIELILLPLIIIGFAAGSWHIAKNEMEADASHLLTVYGLQMDQRLEGMDRMISNLLEEPADLVQLSDPDENIRIYASIRLKNALGSSLKVDGSAEYVIVSDIAYGIDVADGYQLSAEERAPLFEAARENALEAMGLDGFWRVINGSKGAWICKTAVSKGRSINVFLRADSLMKSIYDSEKGSWRIEDQTGFMVANKGGELSERFLVTQQYTSAVAPFALCYCRRENRLCALKKKYSLL